ncbi:MAG: response regulator [Acidobacteriota bacterium]|nr:response regulator [Acidobacteriota bacterium]
MVNILLVEDEEQLRSMLKEVLQGAGHEVREAENGKVAMNLFARQPADLVITDLIMPEKEGLEIIRELKRSNLNVKIIAISGGGRNDAQDYLELARRFGADHILAKPFSNREILDVVDKLVEL